MPRTSLLLTLLLNCCAVAALAQKPEPAAVLKLASNPGSAEFQKALAASFSSGQLEKGEAWLGQGRTILVAIKTAGTPQLFVDDAPGPKLQAAGGLLFATVNLAPYTSHTFHYVIDGKRFGGKLDVPVFGPEAEVRPGAVEGKLSEKILHRSKLYEGMESEFWIYATPGVDPAKPAPLMIWQDGQNYADRTKANRLLIQLDNLVADQKIPAMVHVFIAPGKIGARAMRSVEYDTFTDKYPRFLLEEILPEVAKRYKLRSDAYSRAIAGESSGAICAFNAAWWKPEEFSRVYSRIGSYTSIQWKPGELEGGNVYPFAVRKQSKRNIRVYLSDGSEDLENNHGSWPLQNIQMANSLKLREYDFKFVWGSGPHSTQMGHAEIPIALPWLWREYDAAKTTQDYQMDPAEKDKPFFRVKALNRQ